MYKRQDIVHVFANGKVALTGGPELADQLEEHGYDAFVTKGA